MMFPLKNKSEKTKKKKEMYFVGWMIGFDACQAWRMAADTSSSGWKEKESNEKKCF